MNAMGASLFGDTYMEMLLERQGAQSKRETLKNMQRTFDIEKRLGELDQIIRRLFEKSALGAIPDDRAEAMMRDYEQESEQLKTELETITAELEKAQQADTDVRTFISLIQRYTDIKELNAAILNELIDRIVVHEKETDSDGNITQRVDINYRFVGFPLIYGARDESHLSTMLFAAHLKYGLENLPRFAEEHGLTDILFPAREESGQEQLG